MKLSIALTATVALMSLNSFAQVDGHGHGNVSNSQVECRNVENLDGHRACAKTVETEEGFTLLNPSLGGRDIKPSKFVAEEICNAFFAEYGSYRVKVLAKTEGVVNWNKREEGLEVTVPFGADTFPTNIISKIHCVLKF